MKSEIGPKEQQVRALREAREDRRRVKRPSAADLRDQIAAVKSKVGKPGKKRPKR